MSKRKQVLLAFLLFDLLLVVIFAGTFLLRNSEARDRSELGEMGVALIPDQPVLGDFQLTDQQGLGFTNSDFADKWNLVFFGFTSCPDVCPLTMKALDQFYQDLALSEFESDTRVIMVSVDPQRDTVEKMASYVASFNADFIGLTGQQEVISKLAKQLYIAFTEPPQHADHGTGTGTTQDYEIQHSGYIAVVAPDGSFRGVMRAPHNRQSIKQAYYAIRDI